MQKKLINFLKIQIVTLTTQSITSLTSKWLVILKNEKKNRNKICWPIYCTLILNNQITGFIDKFFYIFYQLYNINKKIDYEQIYEKKSIYQDVLA